MNTLQLPRTIVNQILKLAQNSPEAEICGLLGGRNGVAESCHPVQNSAELQQIRFEMEPKQQIDALRNIRERGESLLAIYHSHPHSEAAPSATDLAEAAYPDSAHLIISLNTEGVLEMSAFSIKNGNAEAIALELI